MHGRLLRATPSLHFLVLQRDILNPFYFLFSDRVSLSFPAGIEHTQYSWISLGLYSEAKRTDFLGAVLASNINVTHLPTG